MRYSQFDFELSDFSIGKYGLSASANLNIRVSYSNGSGAGTPWKMLLAVESCNTTTYALNGVYKCNFKSTMIGVKII